MDKNEVISDTHIPPKDAEKTELIMVKVTSYEKEFFETLTSILSELDVDEKGTKVIKNNSLSDFVSMSLSVVSMQIFFYVCKLDILQTFEFNTT